MRVYQEGAKVLYKEINQEMYVVAVDQPKNLEDIVYYLGFTPDDEWEYTAIFDEVEYIRGPYEDISFKVVAFDNNSYDQTLCGCNDLKYAKLIADKLFREAFIANGLEFGAVKINADEHRSKKTIFSIGADDLYFFVEKEVA